MTEHTPGPWHVAPQGKAQSPWIVCDPEGGSVADCEPPGPWMPIEIASANARLIAAAPDLLESLRSLMVAYGASDGRNGNSGECWDKARSAIAKAEGHPSR